MAVLMSFQMECFPSWKRDEAWKLVGVLSNCKQLRKEQNAFLKLPSSTSIALKNKGPIEVSSPIKIFCDFHNHKIHTENKLQYFLLHTVDASLPSDASPLETIPVHSQLDTRQATLKHAHTQTVDLYFSSSFSMRLFNYSSQISSQKSSRQLAEWGILSVLGDRPEIHLFFAYGDLLMNLPSCSRCPLQPWCVCRKHRFT